MFIHVGALAAGQHPWCGVLRSGSAPISPACGRRLAPATLSPARRPSSTCSSHHCAHLEARSCSASTCASACGARWWSFASSSAGGRSSLLAGLDALWHSGAPLLDRRCQVLCWVVYPARLLLWAGDGGAVCVILLPGGIVEACLHCSCHRGRFWDESPLVLLTTMMASMDVSILPLFTRLLTITC